jgi:hypothetical protein
MFRQAATAHGGMELPEHRILGFSGEAYKSYTRATTILIVTSGFALSRIVLATGFDVASPQIEYLKPPSKRDSRRWYRPSRPVIGLTCICQKEFLGVFNPQDPQILFTYEHEGGSPDGNEKLGCRQKAKMSSESFRASV